jgi:hypothetical protein
MLIKVVNGDSISVREAAAVYKEVYGVEPNFETAGSLDDLYKRMIEAREAQPENLWAWMAL